jgi:tRNA pseudouridine38-40 synthase
MRISLKLSYNGREFFGSQRQKEIKNTVLGELEHVLSELNIEQKVIASGRTDRGVHATGQICHIDLPEFWSDLDKLKIVLNSMLPAALHVESIKKVSDEFHARYSAKRRVYRYIIKEGESNPFEDNFVTFVKQVNFAKIQKDIKLFIGEHDFKYFMKSGSDIGSTTREIYKAFAYKHKGYTILNFEANGFLRSQVRLMVGALFDLDEDKIKEKLACKTNHKLKPAKANGLYLAKIKY